ncbi:MAG: ATP-binding cassette domain-containing protein [Christensenella sp.]|jgi:iron complex transport system ATP-binding protein|nr:ATP-binding cassette domain-containing protein [Christensenella sp.]
MYFETHDLSVGYGGRPLIEKINLSIEKGRILTLIGPNGSGKSTILKTITKHLEKIAGVVTIENDNISKWSNKELAKRLSVMLTERIDPELMTCEQVVAMGRYPYTNHFGSLTPGDRQVVEESLHMVRAEELAERPFTDISDGQRQRIMLARAICQQPEIIMLDEPTSYLDIRHKIELLDILRKMAREKNVAVVMSLHEIDLAAKISDQIICVKGDRIRLFGTPEQVFTGERVKELYELESGSFNTLFGSVELMAPEGEPEIFVLAGAGKGIPIYRLLQKSKRAFSTGVLFENDVDLQVASALAAHVTVAPAFGTFGERELNEAKRWIDRARCVVDAGTPVGEQNRRSRELIQYARTEGKRVITGAEAFENIDAVPNGIQKEN